jgi:DNA-binding SARP family transcriptional activator
MFLSDLLGAALRGPSNATIVGVACRLLNGGSTPAHVVRSSPVELRILGPLEARAGGRSLPLGGPRQRALLAALLLRAHETISVDRLIDDLWGESPPATAEHSIQVLISRLRRALGDDGPRLLVTRPPGYAIEPAADELDLTRFEFLVAEGRQQLGAGQPERARTVLREALGLWRGKALADLSDEPFAQLAVPRLDELRLAAIEERIEADLACGRHSEVVGELEELVVAEPLRERLRGQLMLALYRCGRQAEALEVYQRGRRRLVDELGIDPSKALQRLEARILQQDTGLELEAVEAPAARPKKQASAPAPPSTRAVLVAADDADELARMVELALPLARGENGHELLLSWLVTRPDELGAAVRAVNERRQALSQDGLPARAVAYTSDRVGDDLVRLAAEQQAQLVLLGVEPEALGTPPLPVTLATLLEQAPCDVAAVVARPVGAPDSPVLVPFGGDEHEWAALEVAAWFAGTAGVELRLLGAASDPERGRRDASRLLGHAALAVQQLAGVATEPLLVDPGPEAAVEAAENASLVVLGLPDDWRRAGLGGARLALARRARPPVLVVRRGLRPGGIAPDDGLTRFTWSLARR